MKAALSLTERVSRVRRLVDEAFEDLATAVGSIEDAMRGILGTVPALPERKPAEVRELRPRRGRPPAKKTVPRGGQKRGKRSPEQRARIAAAVKASWARRGSKAKAQVAAVGAPAPAARKPEPRREPWKPPNAGRALDSIPLKQTAEEARAAAGEKERAEERKRRVRVNADDVL